jgi:8-oxo-dGTP diphosphatase
VRVPWDYATHHVDLDVHRITRWRGEPHGREGQGVQWLDATALRRVPMPPADRPVVAALQLPPVMLVTSAELAPDALLERVGTAVRHDVRLVQLRADRATVARVGAALRALTRARAVTLIVNGEPAVAQELDADGVQLSAAAARALEARPFGPERWLGVSCHDATELAHALAIGADYAIVGAVLPTATHQDRAPLGWPAFAALVQDFPLPVYAIGGLSPADLETARRHGAFGVAGIRAFTK